MPVVSTSRRERPRLPSAAAMARRLRAPLALAPPDIAMATDGPTRAMRAARAATHTSLLIIPSRIHYFHFV